MDRSEDALHCNRRTVAAINAQSGDWCLALKANQDSLASDAGACFGTVKGDHPVARFEETRARDELAQQVLDNLECASAQVGIEGLPVPPTHRGALAPGTRAPFDPGVAAAMRTEWRRQAGRGVLNRVLGRRCPRFCRHFASLRDVGTGPPGRAASHWKGWIPSCNALN